MQGASGGGQRTSAPRRGRWSQAEVARLREMYGLRDEASIARELNRPIATVRKMAEDVCRSEPRTGPWTADEVQRLKQFLGASAPETIAHILGRPVGEVGQQIFELGRIQQAGRWTREEVADFRRIFGTRTDEDLARIFGRSIEAIRRQAQKYSLAKDKAFMRRLRGEAATRMPRWTDAELELLREMYPLVSNLDIAQKLQRSVKSVVSKAHNMGLKKDPQRLRQMGRENVSLRYRG